MTAVTGLARYQSDTARFNALRFMVLSLLTQVRTCIAVEVISCTNTGAIAPAGTVVVQPLINQLDGAGNAIPHGHLYNVPYVRLQGGGNALILDPVAGDTGLACFADRDISTFKRTFKRSNPGTLRSFDMADAVYVGSILSQAPITQSIAFSSTGLVLTDKWGNIISMQSGKVAMTTPLLDVSGDIHSNGIPVGYTHTHPDPQGGNTGPPNP